MIKKYKNISVISTGSWVPEHLDNKTVDQRYNVIIKNLIIDASIGIHEHEKIKKQRVSISLSIEVKDNISLVDQKIENFLSYDKSALINMITQLLNCKNPFVGINGKACVMHLDTNQIFE